MRAQDARATGSGAQPVPPEPELAALIATEARLDRELADARAEADARRDAARRDAAARAIALDGELAAERARVEEELARSLRERRAAIEDGARAEAAWWASLEGDRLARVAARLVARVAAIVLEEAP